MWWKRFLFIFALGLNVLLFYRLIWNEQGLTGYRHVQAQHEAFQNRLASLDQQNLLLSREIRLLQTDDGYLEKIIRERFNFLYVKDNEILYIFPEQNGDPSNGRLPG